VAALLSILTPSATLLVLSDKTPIGEFTRLLRESGVPQATMLHEAMGFPSRGVAGAPAQTLSGAASASTLLRRFKASLGSGAGSADTEGAPALPPRVLVTTEVSVRGLDLPGLDCVVLLYCPLTSDAYTHLAGRTGRGRAAAR